MARTKTISDEQILEAAREMFDRHGLTVTTAQIADAAGVSEGSIFRRWSTKEDLMVAAFGLRRPPFLDSAAEMIHGEESLEVQVTMLADQMLDFFIEHIPKMSAMLACGSQMKEKMLQSGESVPAQAVCAVMRFFEHHRRQGSIKAGDPEVAGRMLIAAMQHYAFAEFAGMNAILAMPRETFVRNVVGTLLRGLGYEPTP